MHDSIYRCFESIFGDLGGLPPACDDRLRMNSGVDQFFSLAQELRGQNDNGGGSVTDFVILRK